MSKKKGGGGRKRKKKKRREIQIQINRRSMFGFEEMEIIGVPEGIRELLICMSDGFCDG